MTKRLLAGPLWFLAVWLGYAIVAAILGTPAVVGPVLALVVTTLVVLDPGGVVWPPIEPLATSRRPRSIAGEPASEPLERAA